MRCDRKTNYLLSMRPSIASNMADVSDWIEHCIIDLTPRDISFFDGPMDRLYGDPKSEMSPFHESPRAIRFPELTSVCVMNTSLLLENEARVLERTELHSTEEVLDKVRQYFPKLREVAEKALENQVLY